MKNKSDQSLARPSPAQANEMILRLDPPYQQMAWLMAETGGRLSGIQSLRVRHVSFARKAVVLPTEQGEKIAALSGGLLEALADYQDCILRPGFEREIRWKTPGLGGRVRMFSDQLLFPAWLLTGLESADVEQPVPAPDFVLALQAAARATGYLGAVQSHTMRLVCASRWLSHGMTIPDLHEHLGHRDLMTTLLLVQALRYGGLTYAAPAPASPRACMAHAGFAPG